MINSSNFNFKIDLDDIKNPYWCYEEFLLATTVNSFWNKKQNEKDLTNNKCLIDKDDECNNKCRTKGNNRIIFHF